MKLFTPLTRDELERLRQLAQAERRRTQDQAAVLIAEGLDRRGIATKSLEPGAPAGERNAAGVAHVGAAEAAR